MVKNIKLIIGLGNPNKEYVNTYHNIGYQFLDFLENQKESGIRNYELRKSAVYMNKSGEFAKEQLKRHKIKPESLLIVHDDADIQLGNYKLSFGRGSAGHKGVQNIIDRLKTKNFWRLRIGIRQSQEKIRPKADQLVLKKISPVNKKILEKTFLSVLSDLSDL